MSSDSYLVPPSLFKPSTGPCIGGSKTKSPSVIYCLKFSSMSGSLRSLLNGKLYDSYRKVKIRCGRAWTRKNDVLTSGSRPLDLDIALSFLGASRSVAGSNLNSPPSVIHFSKSKLSRISLSLRSSLNGKPCAPYKKQRLGAVEPGLK